MASDVQFQRAIRPSGTIFFAKQSTRTLSFAVEPAMRRQLTPTQYGFERGIALNLSAALFAGMAVVAPAAASSRMEPTRRSLAESRRPNRHMRINSGFLGTNPKA
jgi:hypothetical protein